MSINGRAVTPGLGWGIRCRFKGERPFLCGIYYFAYNQILDIPQALRGCTTAVFKTRAVAREYCRKIRSPENGATVVRIAVKVEEVA